jgi:hypothetical protein
LTSSDQKPLSRNQAKALESLLASPTLGLAASKAGISERTLSRWLNEDDAFKAEYLKLVREVVNNAVFQLQKGATSAVNCLISIMSDPEAPASARVAACREVLTQTFKALELATLEDRVKALEGTLKGSNGYRSTY